MQNVFRRQFGNALQWYQVLEQQMKHKVNSWVQAFSSSHHEQSKPCNKAHIPTNTIPPTDSTPTSHPARTSNPISLIQPSTGATEVVRDEDTRARIITTRKVEGTANPSCHPTCTPMAFPLPSNDSTCALDHHPRKGCPSPDLPRRCPVCFGTSAAKLDDSRYVIITIWALAYQ